MRCVISRALTRAIVFNVVIVLGSVIRRGVV